MGLTANLRRVVACGGGMLAGGVLGAELLSPDGSVKGMLAGLGTGLVAAALIDDEEGTR